MRKLFTLLFIIPTIAFGRGKPQKFIDKNLKNDPHFKNAVVGILAVDEKGKTIAQWNPDLPLLTASTMKTITTGVSLALLGPEYKFQTSIAISGYIENNRLNGDLYIIGGGDPTLGSKDSIAYPIDSIFGIWTSAIRNIGIEYINGDIIADNSYFTDETIPDSWSWGNLGAYYGCAASGLSFHENIQCINISPATIEGMEANIESIYPIVPNMEYENNIITTEGDKSGVSYYISDLSKNGELRGKIGIQHRGRMIDVSNKFPHLSCAYQFREYLRKNHIFSNSEIIDIENISDRKKLYTKDLYEKKIIAITFSPPLIDIINVTNRISNNFYAETLLKNIGKELTGIGSYDSSVVAVGRFLEEYNISTKGFIMEDGSGLSRQNYVSPRFFCNFYEALTENAIFVGFFNSLPVPGQEGTLKDVLKDEDKKVKERIHAKSGSLSNVRCYAGYVEGKKGLIKFAILLNNHTAKTADIQPKIEGFMRELARYRRKK